MTGGDRVGGLRPMALAGLDSVNYFDLEEQSKGRL